MPVQAGRDGCPDLAVERGNSGVPPVPEESLQPALLGEEDEYLLVVSLGPIDQRAEGKTLPGAGRPLEENLRAGEVGVLEFGRGLRLFAQGGPGVSLSVGVAGWVKWFNITRRKWPCST